MLGTLIAPTHVYPSATRCEPNEQDFELFEDYNIVNRATLSDCQRHDVSSFPDGEAQLFEIMRDRVSHARSQ